MGPSRYLLSGMITLGLYQPQLLGISSSGLDAKARFTHRLPWITPEEWETTQQIAPQRFQLRTTRIVDPKMSTFDVLNSLPLLQQMSPSAEEKFAKSTLNNPEKTPANTLTDGYSLGTSADTKLNVMAALGRACLNLPLFQHTGTIKVKSHFFRHHSVPQFEPVNLKTYVRDRYQDFLRYHKTSKMGFENGEFCSTVLIALVNAQTYQINATAEEVYPKWAEYKWKEKQASLRPFTPLYEESFYAFLQTIYTSLEENVSTISIQREHAQVCIDKCEQIQEQQRIAKEIREKKNASAAEEEVLLAIPPVTSIEVLRATPLEAPVQETTPISPIGTSVESRRRTTRI